MLSKFALPLVIAAGVVSGTALAVPSQKTLFVTNNVGLPGSVSSFRVGPDGSLTLAGVYENFGQNPQDVAVTADGTRLLVLNATAEYTVEPLHTATINSDSTLSVNPSPTAVPDGATSIAVSPNDVLLVPTPAAQLVRSYRVLASSASLVDDAFGGGFPTKPLTSSNGQFAYTVGSGATNDVCAHTVSAGGVITNLECKDIVGGGGFGAAIHPSGDTLYVSTGMLNTIVRFDINPATGRLTANGIYLSGSLLDTSAVEIAAHPGGTYLYVCHVLSDTLSVLRVNPDRSLTSTGFSYGVGSDIRDVVTDGQFVFVTDENTSGNAPGVIVYRIEQNGALTQLGPAVATGGYRPQFMALWSPSAVPPACAGDANGDGVVSFPDITATLRNWGGGAGEGDADHDGDVDFPDVTSILGNWNDDCP